jgi:hypothetical protein
LHGQTVALAQRDDGDWAVRFRQFDLAMVGDQSNTIHGARLSRVGSAAVAPTSAGASEADGKHVPG